MKKHTDTHLKFNSALDMPGRIALVMAAHIANGHVDRKTLMRTYDVTQIQAGSLMRDFIQAHANKLTWCVTHAHYKLT